MTFLFIPSIIYNTMGTYQHGATDHTCIQIPPFLEYLLSYKHIVTHVRRHHIWWLHFPLTGGPSLSSVYRLKLSILTLLSSIQKILINIDGTSYLDANCLPSFSVITSKSSCFILSKGPLMLKCNLMLFRLTIGASALPL